MVYYQILNVLHDLGLRISILNLCAPFMVEMDHCHADDSIVNFVIPLVVLINNFL